MNTLPLSPSGIFRTIQGEGRLMGVPMIFVRLGGCSVGCEGCDTNYTVAERLTLAEIGWRVNDLWAPAYEWCFVTGGEPTIHDLMPLYKVLRMCGQKTMKIALATAGINKVSPLGYAAGGPDFVSVSPHKIDSSWVQRAGDQLNIVPGLNGLRLADLEGVGVGGFGTRYVTPMSGGDAAECRAWVESHAGWRLGHQAHLCWRIA